jgi:hypothetical protein
VLLKQYLSILANPIFLKKIMNRFIFSVLFIFGFFVLNVNAQQPKLQLVSMDTLTHNLIVKWLYDEEIDPIVIYKCMGNCSYNGDYKAVDTSAMDQNNLEWIDPAPKMNTADYYSIGWYLSDKQQTPQCNMHLDTNVSVHGCRNEVSLSWNPYINMLDELDYYKIFYRIKGHPSSFFTLFDSIKGTHISARFEEVKPSNIICYNARFLENGTTYEFVIQAVNKTRTLFSYSNIVEYKTGFQPNSPVSVNITGVSVIDDEYISIDINTDIFPIPFHNLYLSRRVESDPSLTFNLIDSTESSSLNQYRFTDKSVDQHSGLYYYMAVAENKCKASDTSNVLSNIFLSGFRVEGVEYKDSVFFFHEEVSPFDTYELLRLVGGKKHIITDALTVQYSKCLVDIEPFMEEGAIIHYQVRSQNDCFSNILTIEHEPQVIFPNAFYPQSIGIENRTFYPIIKFASEADYLFIIYNRWGQELYSSVLPPVYGDYNNPQGRWDGTFQGQECPSGFYAYKIRYSFNGGSGKYSTSGSFMLVR